MSDLISREDAIKHIKAYRDEFKEDFGIDSEDGDDASHHFGYIAGLNRATRIIKDLPPAERKERWLFNRQYHEADECVCSGCGQLMTTIHGERMNYCPNCGAKMEVTE